MDENLEDLNIDELYRIYSEQFGHTFTMLLVKGKSKEPLAKKLMAQAINGDRGFVTDADLSIGQPPPGALI